MSNPVPEPAVDPDYLQPVPVTPVEEQTPQAPEETERHGEQEPE